MGESPFQLAIEAVLRPLEFAARDAAAADRIQDLEATVCAAARRVLALAIPGDARKILEHVAADFAEPVATAERTPAIESALRSLTPLATPQWSEEALGRSAAVLPGIGTRRVEALKRRGLGCVNELLFHLPLRYDDRRTLARVADLVAGLRRAVHPDPGNSGHTLVDLHGSSPSCLGIEVSART